MKNNSLLKGLYEMDRPRPALSGAAGVQWDFDLQTIKAHPGEFAYGEGGHLGRVDNDQTALVYETLRAEHPEFVVIEFSCARQARMEGKIFTWNQKGTKFYRLVMPACRVGETFSGLKYLIPLGRAGFRPRWLAEHVTPTPDEGQRIRLRGAVGKARWMVDRGLLAPEKLLHA